MVKKNAESDSQVSPVIISAIKNFAVSLNVYTQLGKLPSFQNFKNPGN